MQREQAEAAKLWQTILCISHWFMYISNFCALYSLLIYFLVINTGESQEIESVKQDVSNVLSSCACSHQLHVRHYKEMAINVLFLEELTLTQQRKF